MYKLIYDQYNLANNCVIKIEGNLQIPFAPDNTDYQAYLKWVSEGNVPEQAD